MNRYVKVQFPPHAREQTFHQLIANSAIESVEPVPLYYPFFHPPFGNPDDYSPLTSKHLELVKLAEAWRYNFGRPEVAIAVVDNGFDWTHEDLAPNVRVNVAEIPNNGIDDDDNGYVDDYIGYDAADNDGDVRAPTDSLRPFLVHGTVCASVAAAATHNGKGMAGAGFRCRFLPVKAVSDTISFAALTHSYEAVEYAIAAGADVIAMSFGSSVYSAYFRDLLLTAHDRGIVCVAAAGNAGAESVQYPCGYETVLCVTSVDFGARKYPSANYGPWIDVCAAGEALAANWFNGYRKRVGTSVACAVVAGVCGLLKSHLLGAAPDDIHRAVVESAQNLDSLNADYTGKLGGGLLNAAEAMRKLRPIHCEPTHVSHLRGPKFVLKMQDFFPTGTGP
ncbi:MAG: S8 family serine peptidase, partial [Bacteroidia bacterium]|nr:S8 family serine peptidase [Bacteroidia bacterium]